jgi:gluconokinase
MRLSVLRADAEIDDDCDDDCDGWTRCGEVMRGEVRTVGTVRRENTDGLNGQDVVVVMGVAGTGKTTVGRLLAEALGVPYAEADGFHPPANVAKMSAGIPLDDTDRAPWLDAIGAWAHRREGLGGVVSCSALKRVYRDRLRAAAPGIVFLHLTGDRALIGRRMAERAGHFMPVALLDSQFATLEPLEADEPGVSVDVLPGPEAVSERALRALSALRTLRTTERPEVRDHSDTPTRRSDTPTPRSDTPTTPRSDTSTRPKPPRS